MRAALYYPHTDVEDLGIVKSALLMWDRLEHITPTAEYRSHYSDMGIAKAMELIGKPHVPSAAEMAEAHDRVVEMIESKVPPEFYLKQKRTRGLYEMYPQKLLPKTWEELRKASMAGRLRANGDYPFMEPAGLTIMSILADCCAGQSKARVTDRGDAYASINSLLVDGPLSATSSYDAAEGLVPFALQVANLDGFDLNDLIDFRVREEKERGHTLRDLRHRYVDNMSKYLDRIRKEARSQSDVVEIRYQYFDDMRIDLAHLKAEISGARREAVLSKEVLVTLVGGVALLAAVTGGAPVELPSVVAPTGALVTLGGLIGVGNKYATARRSILLKHPMAYLYELQGSIHRP